MLINLVVGFHMLIANRAYLRVLDEMQQKILLEAMALALEISLNYEL